MSVRSREKNKRNSIYGFFAVTLFRQICGLIVNFGFLIIFPALLIDEYVFYNYSALLLASVLVWGISGQVLLNGVNAYRSSLKINFLYILLIAPCAGLTYVFNANILFIPMLALVIANEQVNGALISRYRLWYLELAPWLLTFCIYTYAFFKVEFANINQLLWFTLSAALVRTLYFYGYFFGRFNYKRIDSKIFKTQSNREKIALYSVVKSIFQNGDRVIVSYFASETVLVGFHYAKLLAEPIRLVLQNISRSLQADILSRSLSLIQFFINNRRFYIISILFLFLYFWLVMLANIYLNEKNVFKYIDAATFTILLLVSFIRYTNGFQNAFLFKRERFTFLSSVIIMNIVLFILFFILFKNIGTLQIAISIFTLSVFQVFLTNLFVKRVQ